jgi:hypothetical protein
LPNSIEPTSATDVVLNSTDGHPIAAKANRNIGFGQHQATLCKWLPLVISVVTLLIACLALQQVLMFKAAWSSWQDAALTNGNSASTASNSNSVLARLDDLNATLLAHMVDYRDGTVHQNQILSNINQAAVLLKEEVRNVTSESMHLKAGMGSLEQMMQAVNASILAVTANFATTTYVTEQVVPLVTTAALTAANFATTTYVASLHPDDDQAP